MLIAAYYVCVYVGAFYVTEMLSQMPMGVYLSRAHFNEWTVLTWICFFLYVFLIQIQVKCGESGTLQ